MKKIIAIFIISFLIISSIYAETIRVITPYLGTIENDMSKTIEGSQNGLSLKDNSLLKGLYLQSINPGKYQWNAFVYNSEDLNYSSLWGTHFIFDYYPGAKEKSEYVIGAGIEFIRMETKTDKIVPFSNFELSQDIYAPYLRAGKYFYFGENKIKYSLMPWLGLETDIIRGDIDFTIPGMPMPVTDIDDDSYYAMAGMNFKVTFYHFIDLKLKYHGKIDLKENDYFDIASSIINIYFNKSWGISYRAKYIKTADIKNTYHIGGIVYAF